MVRWLSFAKNNLFNFHVVYLVGLVLRKSLRCCSNRKKRGCHPASWWFQRLRCTSIRQGKIPLVPWQIELCRVNNKQMWSWHKLWPMLMRPRRKFQEKKMLEVYDIWKYSLKMLRIDCLLVVIQKGSFLWVQKSTKSNSWRIFASLSLLFSSFVEHLCKMLDLAIESSIGFWMLTFRDWFFDHTSQKQRPGRWEAMMSQENATDKAGSCPWSWKNCQTGGCFFPPTCTCLTTCWNILVTHFGLRHVFFFHVFRGQKRNEILCLYIYLYINTYYMYSIYLNFFGGVMLGKWVILSY